MHERRALAVVVAGGALGAAARHLLAQHFTSIWTILVINVVGSMLLGILAAVLGPDRLRRLFLGVGVLGGFTTFSAFAVDAVQNPEVALPYVLGTLLPALLAARLGMGLGEILHTRRRTEPS